jgi:hypothetical protein
MNEETCRKYKIILLAILVTGTLAIGAAVSQTGRYVQFDLRKSCTPDGHTRLEKPPAYVIDTWSGRRIATE